MQAKHSISVVIATAFREKQLANALRSILSQTYLPIEIIIVDGAPAPGVEALVSNLTGVLDLELRYCRWSPPSAAVQRNVGVEKTRGELILFLDDDAYPEPDCFEKMVRVFDEDMDQCIGGVGVLISNQPCLPPSPRAKRWLDLMADEKRESYSGTVIGPALNTGPEPRDDSKPVPVEWLNSGCTAYRREAFLPQMFCSKFFGYSYMEDVDVSIRVAREWKLYVHTGAFMFHDSHPSPFKKPYVRAKMTIVNRYFVMTKTMNRISFLYHAKFFAHVFVTFAYSTFKVKKKAEIGTVIFSGLGFLVGCLQVFPETLLNIAKSIWFWPGNRPERYSSIGK